MTDTNENDGLEPTDRLRGMLEDLTQAYSGADRVITVKWTDGPSRISQDGETIHVNADVKSAIGRDISGVQELRVILDTLCHEVAHDNYSDLNAKAEIAEEYPEHPKVAGHVANILEDQYIDRQRLIRNPALRGVHAFKIDKIMENGHRRPPMDSKRLSPAETLVEGLTQVAFAGGAKNIGQADPKVQAFLSWVEPKIEEVEHTHNPDARMELFREVVDKLISYLDDMDADPGDIDDFVDDDDITDTDGMPDPTEPAESDDDDENGEGDESDYPDDDGDDDADTHAGDDDDGDDDGDDADDDADTHAGDDDDGDDDGDGDAPQGDGGAESGDGAGNARDVTDLLGGRDPSDCKVIL